MSPAGQQQADVITAQDAARRAQDERELANPGQAALDRARDVSAPAAGQSVIPASTLPPAAQAAKQAWEAQNPGLTAPWEVVSRQVLDAERQAAAAAEQQRLDAINAAAQERVPAAQAELAKDTATRDPVRAEQEAAARRAIVEAAQARNLDNFKRGVGHGTQNPNGVTDEQREAHWRVQAAKGDKYARAVAIGHIQTIEARRAESLRREEINAPVKTETARGAWQTEVARIGGQAAIDKAGVDADGALAVAMQNGDVATAVAALKSETDLIVGLANAAAKDNTIDDADKQALKGYSAELSSLQTELNGMKRPKLDDYDDIDENTKTSPTYTEDLKNYNTRMGELRSDIEAARRGVRSLVTKRNKGPSGVGAALANPGGAGDGMLPGVSLPPSSVAGAGAPAANTNGITISPIGSPPPTTGGKGGRNPAPEGTPVRMRDGRLAYKVNGQWVYKDTGEAVKQ
jgi:hypothetical protein